jgi:glucokinase
MTREKRVIGVDVGGTKIAAGLILSGHVQKESRISTPAGEGEGAVVDAVIRSIEEVYDDRCEGIGIGVPSVVDVVQGIVYDVFAIPSWKEVRLKERIEGHFQKPVSVNNDSNCFALGEKHFGSGRGFRDLVGLTVGTGLGSGVIVNHKLYAGTNCGAGEFGCIPYKEGILEEYSSGQFFLRQHGIDGHAAWLNATAGDPDALRMFDEFGRHLGAAITIIMFSVDPEAIIIGGSIGEAFPLFRRSMLDTISDFPYVNSAKRLKIIKSELSNAALLGAGALVADQRSS